MLELASFPPDLNSAAPTASDPITQGWQHLNLIKAVISNTFPNLHSPVTSSADDLNSPIIRTRGTNGSSTVPYYTSASAAGTLPVTALGAEILGCPDLDTLVGDIGSAFVATGGSTMSGGLVVPEVVLNNQGTFSLQTMEGVPTLNLGDGFAVQNNSGHFVIICGGIEVFWIDAAGNVTIRGTTTENSFI